MHASQPHKSRLPHNHAHRLGKIKQLEGKFVFFLLVCRLAHASTVLGQLESKRGYHFTEIIKYTHAALDWLIDK